MWWTHLVAAAEVGVLVGERVEAVRAARDDLAYAGRRRASRRSARRAPGRRTRCPSAAPGRRCRPRAGPRIAKSTPAACSSLAVDSRDCARALVEDGGAADPVEELGRRLARLEHAHAEPLGPGRALDLRLAPRVRRALDVAQHRLGLGREARIDHHQLAAQIDDVVDVLDRHRAGLDAGAAGDAVPDHLVADRRCRHERRQPVARPRARAGPSAKTWSRSPMISSFGESALPVANAGQASWQRPHSVQENAVEHLLPGQVGDRAGAEAQSRRPARRSAAARAGRGARVRPKQTLIAGRRDVQVLGVGEVGEEREHERSRCAQTNTRSATRARRPRPKRCESAFESGDQLARATRSGPARSARRARQQRDARRPAIRRGSGRPRRRWLPSKRCRPHAPCGSTSAATTPSSTSSDEDVDEHREPALVRRATGASAWRSTAPIIAITIVGKSTKKPQKMNACIRPGPEPLQQLALAEHERRLVAHARADVVRSARPACRHAHEPPSSSARRANRPPRDREDQRRARRRRRATLSRPLAFRSSALIAGHDLVQVADHRVVGAARGSAPRGRR